MLNKVKRICLNVLPIVLMIGLIPFVGNDYMLTLLYVLIIAVSFLIKYCRNDFLVFFFGFFVMFVIEYFFISMGVERFIRKSLLSAMPFWLPILWAYGFVAIKRSVVILIQK